MDGYAEDWMILCKQAAQEQDPARLLSLVKRINDLLDLKHKHLRHADLPTDEESPAV